MLLEVQGMAGKVAQIEVGFHTPLGQVQKALCLAFGQRFPATKATLTVDGETYDEFIQKPFHRCKEGDNIIVRFNDTDDPYFYDWFDRKGSKLKLEEEIALEKVPPLVL